MGVSYRWTPDDEIAERLAKITDRHERAWYALAVARLDDLHNDAMDAWNHWVGDMERWIETYGCGVNGHYCGELGCARCDAFYASAPRFG